MTQYSTNFTEREFACRCCGELNDNLNAKHARELLQELRDRWGSRLIINCNNRCPSHNKAVGGKKDSQHLLGCAFDISTVGMNPYADIAPLVHLAHLVGFRGFGMYKNFIHIDTGVEKDSVRVWSGGGVLGDEHLTHALEEMVKIKLGEYNND